jgi:4a-hydroxytetrahydrobiopterin dehydratase
MTPTLTRAQISAVADPLGWRLILGVLTTHVLVPSITDAVMTAQVVVEAAGVDASGHVSLDLRDDRVVVGLHTGATAAVTELDLQLARQITAALSDRNLHCRPGDELAAPQTLEIAIDALDIAAVRPFWRAVTGYVDRPGPADLPRTALHDPLRRGPVIWFQQMDVARPQRNRIHLDVDVPAELAQARVEAALAAGGTLLSAAAAPSFWVLADPEGNEVCICTWQGRD